MDLRQSNIFESRYDICVAHWIETIPCPLKLCSSHRCVKYVVRAFYSVIWSNLVTFGQWFICSQMFIMIISHIFAHGLSSVASWRYPPFFSRWLGQSRNTEPAQSGRRAGGAGSAGAKEREEGRQLFVGGKWWQI